MDRLCYDVADAAADLPGIALDPRNLIVDFPVKQTFQITEGAKCQFNRNRHDHGIVSPRQHGTHPKREWADYAPIPSVRQGRKLACSRSSNLRLMSSPPP